MKKVIIILACFFMGITAVNAQDKQVIKAIYIPLADHYAGIVAYEKYRDQMKKADYRIERMKSWFLLRAYFMSGEVDLAYIVSPLAMDMFAGKPNFRWVSLLHRDGNALAINDLLNAEVQLPEERLKRKPDAKVANAFTRARNKLGRPSECGVPHLLSTHTVVLYKYLKDHGKGLNLGRGTDKDVLAIEVSPSKSPAFIKRQNSLATPASFEQSLPWADIVEAKGFGHVAWYSKDVMPWPKGHVECIAIATDNCVSNKKEALKEVIYYLHKAGLDIEKARQKGGSDMIAISDMIRKHIPEHNQEAIIQSLRLDLNVINYKSLNVDKAGLKQIMDYAVEGNILKRPIDIDTFADESFSTEITKTEIVGTPQEYSGNADRITEGTKSVLDNYIMLLKKWAENPTMVNAVRMQNAKNVSLEEIKEIDREWIAGDKKELAVRLQKNSAGLFLHGKIKENKGTLAELFLCDSKGAVVGEYPKTTDYWQGDEKKFTECYNGGNGKVFVGPLVNDESTKSFSVQISVPVREKGKTIGVLIAGIINKK
jgi:NitT/TauT family transport system substrate-binding protein